MWGPICLLWMCTWSVLGAPFSSTVCPENCECSSLQNGIKAHCSSLDFLSKLRPKQIHEIVELDIGNLSIKTIDRKLRKLRNLKKLDLSNNGIEHLKNFPQLPLLTHLYLSHNRLQQFTASDLPKSVKHLDLSSNRIAVLTDISKLLPNLREINLNDNLLTCECDYLKYRDSLQLNDVHIVRPANCYTPENVRGISSLSVYCVSGKVTYDDLGHMLADEPGSGEDVSAFAAASTSSDVFNFDATEEGTATGDEDDFDNDNEYFRINIFNSSKTDSWENFLEGSGSAYLDPVGGSGDGEFIPISPDPEVPHCYYNCSTPAPDNDTSITEPPVSIKQEISRFLDEINGQTTTTTVSTTTVTTTTTQPPVHEEVVEKNAATISETVVKSGESEKSRASVDAPKQSQTTENTSKNNNTTTYVIVGVLFAAMVALVVYVVVKRNKRNASNRRPASNHEAKEPSPVEMKPLMSVQAQPYKPIPPVERTPLINGQNGTNKKSEAEEPLKDETDRNSPVENGLDEDEPQIRPKKEDDAVLTPGTKRVTIQAKELSSPKSPLLIHRHVGDDGKIISSPVSNNELKYT